MSEQPEAVGDEEAARKQSQVKATTIRDDAIRKWEAIVNGEIIPADLTEKYMSSCSFCQYFANLLPLGISCGPCPLDCLKGDSNFRKWYSNRKDRQSAVAMLEQVRAVTVEQIVEALEKLNNIVRPK